jgi:hypothetical protein
MTPHKQTRRPTDAAASVLLQGCMHSLIHAAATQTHCLQSLLNPNAKPVAMAATCMCTACAPAANGALCATQHSVICALLLANGKGLQRHMTDCPDIADRSLVDVLCIDEHICACNPVTGGHVCLVCLCQRLHKPGALLQRKRRSCAAYPRTVPCSGKDAVHNFVRLNTAPTSMLLNVSAPQQGKQILHIVPYCAASLTAGTKLQIDFCVSCRVEKFC